MAHGLLSKLGAKFGVDSPSASAFGGVVGGDGEYATIQAAIDAEVVYIIVQPGTYVENVTADNDEQEFEFMPGVTVDGTWETTHDNVAITGDPTITGLITWSGDGPSINGENNFQAQAGTDFTGTSAMIDGGGFNSLFTSTSINYPIRNAAADCILGCLSTDGNTGTTSDAISSSGVRGVISAVSVVDSADHGVNIKGNHSIVTGVIVLDNRAGTSGLLSDAGGEQIISGNNGGAISGNLGLFILNSDDVIVSDNIIDSGTANAIAIGGTVDDLVIYGNRTDGAIDYTGAAGEVAAANEETAF